MRVSAGFWLLAVFETLVRWIGGWDVAIIPRMHGTGRAMDLSSLVAVVEGRCGGSE